MENVIWILDIEDPPPFHLLFCSRLFFSILEYFIFHTMLVKNGPCVLSSVPSCFLSKAVDYEYSR